MKMLLCVLLAIANLDAKVQQTFSISGIVSDEKGGTVTVFKANSKQIISTDNKETTGSTGFFIVYTGEDESALFYKTGYPINYIQVPDNEHAVNLKEVKITASNDNTFYGVKGANSCGDYVCKYGILNCSNHPTDPDNRPAVSGEEYFINSFHREKKIYTGCGVGESKNVLKFKGIYEGQEFYPADYSQINPSAPEYISTLYWKHQLKVSSTKDTEFSFYTSDITGRFKIVIQDVTGNDVTYGEKIFNVVKPK
jgi:hypothetical protein